MLEKLAIVGTIGAGVAIGLLWPSGHHDNRAASASSRAAVVIARSSDLQ
jgi:hypothetical protein